ncbi:MAG TPA: hypothetical protein VF714_09910 [Jatrophihabitans sp.]|jgi:hypothetical protein
MDGTGTGRYRLLLIGRAQLAGIIGGAVFGVATWGLLGFLSGQGEAGSLLVVVMFAPLAAIVGGGVGGTIGVTTGVALAFSGRRVLRQLLLGRLVAGSVAAAVPLAVALVLHRPPCHVIPAGVAAVAAVNAVLLTPYILHGSPPPAEWRRGYR